RRPLSQGRVAAARRADRGSRAGRADWASGAGRGGVRRGTAGRWLVRRLVLWLAGWMGAVVQPAALAVVLGVPADRRQPGAPFVAGVGDELPHPLLRPPRGRLGPLAGAEGRLDLGQHHVEGPAQSPDLGPGIAVGDTAGQVPGRDGRRGGLYVFERPQAGADDRYPRPRPDGPPP